MNEAHRRICQDLGWHLYVTNGEVELEKHSPAGEDFLFTVREDDFVKSVWEYYEGFDPDEHAETLALERAAANREGRSNHGIPPIRTLVEDADAIDEMLRELANALIKAEDAA